MNIGIFDQDQYLAQHVVEILERAGYKARAFTNVAETLDYLKVHGVDLLIFGCLSSRGKFGLDALRALRKSHTLEKPMLFLIDRRDEQDVAHVLREGVHDYSLKPVRSVELLARVNALLRHVFKDMVQVQTHHFSDYIFDLTTQTIFVKGRKVNLQNEDFKLAIYLFDNHEMCFSYEHLSRFITSSCNEDNSYLLSSAIARLRKALDIWPTSMGVRLITVYGFGYRLTAARSQSLT